jgi:hypothetical protein
MTSSQLPHVRVPAEVERELRRIAAEEGEGLSVIVRRALRRYLADPEADPDKTAVRDNSPSSSPARPRKRRAR